MADAKKPEPKTVPPALADGAASTDPAVHQLLAHRQIAAMNGDKDAADAATARLAELGYK
jgi:hypothetical protein